MKKIWKVWTVILVVAATVLLTISTQYSKKEEISTDSYQYLMNLREQYLILFHIRMQNLYLRYMGMVTAIQ